MAITAATGACTRNLTITRPLVVRWKEGSMADDKAPNEKRPDDKAPGKFHYNPGNMSGKPAEIFKDESGRRNNADRIRSRDPQQGKEGHPPK